MTPVGAGVTISQASSPTAPRNATNPAIPLPQTDPSQGREPKVGVPIASSGTPVGATAPSASSSGARDASNVLDDTLDAPDTVATLTEQVARRTQLVLLRQQSQQADLQLRLDRMRADFNAAQETRTEQLREMNALRDMAVEQGKKDDEILKKYIAMI